METILFQGDSITDAGRVREDFYNLGAGYPNFVKSMYLANNPKEEATFINRGISGNRVRDLRSRWQEDCIALKPDVLSILIGINDCWRRFDSNDPTPAEKYEDDYRFILNETRQKLPDTRIILMEPFVLPEPADRIAWREDLDPKIHVVRKLAFEFKTDYIALDGIFAQNYIVSNPSLWTPDGVHPTQAGHALIAEHWLDTYLS